MERHEPDGQFYNWYDHRDGSKLTYWPPTGDPLDPILSSVDNAWLATGLRIVRGAVPELANRAGALYDSMDFGFYYVPSMNRILFNYSPAQGTGPCCYDTVVSESRIADYIGIAKGDLPAKEYYGRWRTFPDTCDYSFQETRPSGFYRTYAGVRVYDGSYPYSGTHITPSWGGSMFEALMPSLFVPEEQWGAASWRMNHPLHRRRADRPRAERRAVRRLGLLAVEHARGRLRRLRRRRGRDGPERHAVQRGRHARRPRFRRLPRPAGRARTRRRARTRTAW